MSLKRMQCHVKRHRTRGVAERPRSDAVQSGRTSGADGVGVASTKRFAHLKVLPPFLLALVSRQRLHDRPRWLTESVGQSQKSAFCLAIFGLEPYQWLQSIADRKSRTATAARMERSPGNRKLHYCSPVVTPQSLLRPQVDQPRQPMCASTCTAKLGSIYEYLRVIRMAPKLGGRHGPVAKTFDERSC
jgi:hypothetical protein